MYKIICWRVAQELQPTNCTSAKLLQAQVTALLNYMALNYQQTIIFILHQGM